MNNTVKTRHLSTFEFFESLQVEYICALLRKKIYVKTKDKEHWTKVAEGKRVKIEDIATRNKLPSIFTDSDLMSALSKRIYREDTYPAFVYRDSVQREEQEYLDMTYYFSTNSDVRVVDGSENLFGKVSKPYKPFERFVFVEVDKVEYKVQIEKVIRIL